MKDMTHEQCKAFGEMVWGEDRSGLKLTTVEARLDSTTTEYVGKGSRVVLKRFFDSRERPFRLVEFENLELAELEAEDKRQREEAESQPTLLELLSA